MISDDLAQSQDPRRRANSSTGPKTEAGKVQTAVGRELLAEICNITQQYQLFIREHVEITPTMREECRARRRNWLSPNPSE